VLLDTCRKLELISDTTYKKLKHILDMRNDIGISHPTNYNINAFELLGYVDGFDKHQAASKAGESGEGGVGFVAAQGDTLEAFEFSHRLLDPRPKLVERLREEAASFL
jgi:hypothetical protein